MRVKFFAYIRDYTGCRETNFPDCPDIYTFSHRLCDQYGAKMRAKVLSADGEQLGEEIIILINGRHVAHLGGMQAKLVPSDVVCVFPVVAGG